MLVQVVTKIGCPRCMLLKDKLMRMDVGFEEIGDGALAAVSNKDDVSSMNYPITIIEGTAYDYTATIKKLKEMKNAS